MSKEQEPISIEEAAQVLVERGWACDYKTARADLELARAAVRAEPQETADPDEIRARLNGLANELGGELLYREVAVHAVAVQHATRKQFDRASCLAHMVRALASAKQAVERVAMDALRKQC